MQIAMVRILLFVLLVVNQGMLRIAVSLLHNSKRILFPRNIKPNIRYLMTSSTLTDADSALDGLVQVPIEMAKRYHGQSNVKFLDGSWWLGKRETSNRQDYESGPRISGSHFFDIDDVCSPPGSEDNPKSLPHMMPSPYIFSLAMDAMSIKNDDHVIVYGQKGCPFVYRAYFQIACMGHEYRRVHMLGGSLQDWIEAEGPIDSYPTQAIRVTQLNAVETPSYSALSARNVAEMKEILDFTTGIRETSTLLVDVRSPDRFYGRVEEPRPGLRLGHMPGAKNLFFFNLLDNDEPTKLKPRTELVDILESTLGSDVLGSDRIIASCGSGATACVLTTALIECGVDPSKLFIYDGSWCEWGDDPDTPIVKD